MKLRVNWGRVLVDSEEEILHLHQHVDEVSDTVTFVEPPVAHPVYLFRDHPLSQCSMINCEGTHYFLGGLIAFREIDVYSTNTL